MKPDLWTFYHQIAPVTRTGRAPSVKLTQCPSSDCDVCCTQGKFASNFAQLQESGLRHNGGICRQTPFS